MEELYEALSLELEGVDGWMGRVWLFENFAKLERQWSMKERQAVRSVSVRGAWLRVHPSVQWPLAKKW